MSSSRTNEVLPKRFHSLVHLLTTRGARRVLSNECTCRSLLQDGSLCMQSPMCLLHVSRAQRPFITPLEHDISACTMTSSSSHARTHARKHASVLIKRIAKYSHSTTGGKNCMRTLLNKLAHQRFRDSLYHNGDLVAARGLPRRFLDQLRSRRAYAQFLGQRLTQGAAGKHAPASASPERTRTCETSRIAVAA